MCPVIVAASANTGIRLPPICFTSTAISSSTTLRRYNETINADQFGRIHSPFTLEGARRKKRVA